MKAEADRPPSTVHLPLFPLSTWLYPGIPLSLQIFERRYLDMLAEQSKCNEGFGIVPIRSGREVGKAPGIYPIGVEVRMTDWHQLPNGVLGITVKGERKFRVFETEVRDDQLMLADVGFLHEDPPTQIPEQYEGLSELLRQLKEHPATVTMDLPEPDNSADLGYQLSQLLPLSAQEKMRLLGMANPLERLDVIAHKIGQLSQD
ncbi:ATP-dependent protease [Proteobacteria bacterium 005FR1]|nr:ATP-dependent protease [Proteobacteria bacterium 005FR1]